MLNCHKATRLMSETQERSLTTGEKMSLRFHTMMCAGCRNFGRQVHFLSRAAKVYTRWGSDSSTRADTDGTDKEN